MIIPHALKGSAMTVHSITLAGSRACYGFRRHKTGVLLPGNPALFEVHLLHRQQRQRSQARRHPRRAFGQHNDNLDDEGDQAERTSSKACLHCCFCCGCCRPQGILLEEQQRGQMFDVGCQVCVGRAEGVWLAYCCGRICIHWTGEDPIVLVYSR